MLIFFWRNNEACRRLPEQHAPHNSFRKECLFFVKKYRGVRASYHYFFVQRSTPSSFLQNKMLPLSSGHLLASSSAWQEQAPHFFFRKKSGSFFLNYFEARWLLPSVTPNIASTSGENPAPPHFLQKKHYFLLIFSWWELEPGKVIIKKRQGRGVHSNNRVAGRRAGESSYLLTECCFTFEEWLP